MSESDRPPIAVMMLTGKQGDHYWLEDDSASMIDVLMHCPELVLGKYLVITVSIWEGFDPPRLRQ